MKQKIIILASLLFSLFFFACSQEKPNYVGFWKGEANMIFEVLTENGSDYIIRNVNGDLTAQIVDGSLRGKNSLDMEYVMNVKGDSAYYEFGSITTGYQRISQEEYQQIYASQQKATIIE